MLHVWVRVWEIRQGSLREDTLCMKSFTLGNKTQHPMSIHEDVNVYYCSNVFGFCSQMLMSEKLKYVLLSLNMSR